MKLASLLIPACCLLTAAVVRGEDQTSSNSLLSISRDSSLVVCSNRDSGTVSVFRREGLNRIAELNVGEHPEGTCFIGATAQFACCVYSDDQIVIGDASSGRILRTIEVFDEPYGIVSSADGRFLYATLEYPGQVLRIQADTGEVTDAWDVGTMLRGIALNSAGDRLYVTEYLTAQLIEVDASTGKVLRRLPAASTDNICRQVTLHPTLPWAFLPHIRSKTTAAHGNGSIFPYVTVATLSGEGSRRRHPMDTFRGTRVVANPWETAVSPDGRMMYVVFGATNDIYAATISEDAQQIRFAGMARLGNNPRAVRMIPDGSGLLVCNALDFELAELDPQSLETVRTVSTTDSPLPEPLRTGKILFYTARQPMSGRQWIACSSCHIDGDADGRTWQQPEGLRQTQPLNGLAWTHPLHWSADRDEVQDFEHTIRGLLMQGRGLLRGNLPDALAEPITGRSEFLDALAVYTNSHGFRLSPHARDGLSESAARGRELFFSDAVQCSQCHSGPFYSDGGPNPEGNFRMHDVGTGNDDPSELMGPRYDTPTLLGVYRSAPYLHHGRAATLEDVLTKENPDDRHGVTSHLTPREVADLAEFLRSLPYEDPEPAARTGGRTPISGSGAD